MIPPGLYTALFLFTALTLNADIAPPAALVANGGVKVLLVSSYYDRLATAARRPQAAFVESAVNADNDFYALPTGGAHLVGIAVKLGDALGTPVVSAVQPIFEAREGRSRGGVKGKTPDALTLSAEARPGYVVSELLISAQHDQVRGIKVVFRRLDIYRQTLIAGDMYESEWLGMNDGRRFVRVGDKARPAIGLCGRAADWVLALGLVQAP